MNQESTNNMKTVEVNGYELRFALGNLSGWELPFETDNNSALLLDVERISDASLPGEPVTLVLPEAVDGYPVKHIDNGAFSGHDELTEIVLPKCLESINVMAFDGCASLRSLVIPASVHYVVGCAFCGCKRLAIEVEDDNTVYSAVDGVLYNKDKTWLVAWPTASGEVVLPQGLKGIAWGAFSGCKELTDVKFPESLEELQSGAFQGCSQLKAVTLPSGIKRMNPGAFALCEQLETITFTGDRPVFTEGPVMPKSGKVYRVPRDAKGWANETTGQLPEILFGHPVESI